MIALSYKAWSPLKSWELSPWNSLKSPRIPGPKCVRNLIIMFCYFHRKNWIQPRDCRHIGRMDRHIP